MSFFQFLDLCYDTMHSPIQIEAQNGRIRSWKNGDVWLKKSPFWNLIHKLKLNFMPVALLIFQQFRANTSFLSLKSPVSQQSNNATQQSCFSSNSMPKALNISLVVITPSKLQDLIKLCLQVVRTQTVNCIFQILFSKL